MRTLLKKMKGPWKYIKTSQYVENNEGGFVAALRSRNSSCRTIRIKSLIKS